MHASSPLCHFACRRAQARAWSLPLASPTDSPIAPRCREVGRAALPALQAAAPLTSTATAAAAAAADDEARTAAASRGRGRASPPVKNSQAADVQELRSVLKKYGRDGSGTLSWARSTRRRRRGGTAAPESATADGPPAASSSRSSGGRGARRPGSGAASGSGCAQAQASKSGVRELVPLRLTPTERHARQLESVRVNKAICSQFDRLDRQLTRGAYLLAASCLLAAAWLHGRVAVHRECVPARCLHGCRWAPGQRGRSTPPPAPSARPPGPGPPWVQASWRRASGWRRRRRASTAWQAACTRPSPTSTCPPSSTGEFLHHCATGL